VPPAWAWPATLSLGLIGLAISAYLTIVHYSSSVTLACTSNGTINCEKVTSSPQSELLGVPVALWGSVYFVVLIAACLPWAWTSRAPAIRIARMVLVVAGVGMVLRLIYAELFEIDAICLWCTAVHVVMVALFGAVVIATAVAQASD
jgi:uncharacterized membrane protein